MKPAPTPVERARRAFPRRLHCQNAYLAGWNAAAGIVQISLLVGSHAESVGAAEYRAAHAEAMRRAAT